MVKGCGRKHRQLGCGRGCFGLRSTASEKNMVLGPLSGCLWLTREKCARLPAKAGIPKLPESARPQNPVQSFRGDIADDFDLIEKDIVLVAEAPMVAPVAPRPPTHPNTARAIGTTKITQGNIGNDHIFLRSFFDKFPANAIGGPNRASAAPREIAVDWDCRHDRP
jgi:hypothetical protein